MSVLTTPPAEPPPIPERYLYTVEQLAANPPPGQWELVRGKLVEVPRGMPQHGRLVMSMAALLHAHVQMQRSGRLYLADTGFVLERKPDTLRGPDVAFVPNGRLPEDETVWMNGGPDVIVEVVSPSQRRGEMLEKIQQFLDAGTLVAVTVWPEQQSVMVHRPDVEPVELSGDDVVRLDPVLPGFRCTVNEIFAG
jgi:Uma2 family endonuclease